jgi:Uncharacterized protein conserved in bacteria (DUF2065).
VWPDLARALALVLVIEGVLPFVSPSAMRRVLARALSLDDRSLRAGGLILMIGGLVLLQAIRWFG